MASYNGNIDLLSLNGAKVFKGIDKSEYGRCVLPLRVDARRANEGIIGPIDERVSV